VVQSVRYCKSGVQGKLHYVWILKRNGIGKMITVSDNTIQRRGKTHSTPSFRQQKVSKGEILGIKEVCNINVISHYCYLYLYFA